MLHVPSMEGLGRCWWKAMALPLDTRRQTTTRKNGPGCEVQAQSCRPQAAPRTDCAAQNAGAKRPYGTGRNVAVLTVHAHATGAGANEWKRA